MPNSADVLNLKPYFPFFAHNPDLVYLDNAASTQICQSALDKINHYYCHQHSNVHRSTHATAQQTTNEFEQVRQQVANWLNVTDKNQIIWTKGATEAANLLAYSLSNSLSENDEVIVSNTDHHANFVTWQQVAKHNKLKFKTLSLTQAFKINLEALKTLVSNKTKIVALTHVANATGVQQPIEDAIKIIRQLSNAKIIIDGSQAINHLDIDLTKLDCDFYFFSGHKMHAGTGIGVLYGKHSALMQLSPFQYGGEMVSQVTAQATEFNQLPYKFEAGTPNMAGVLALGATLDFLNQINLPQVRKHEAELIDSLYQQLSKIESVKILGQSDFIGAISFTINDWHPADVGELLNQMNFAVRVGKHCAMPLFESINLSQGSIRVSVAMYNSQDEIDDFCQAIAELKDFLFN